MTRQKYLTPDETRTAARLLLTQVTSDAEHVAADLAEANGDEKVAHELRDGHAFGPWAGTDLVVDAEHLPPTMRKIQPWLLLVAAYADEDTNFVIGHNCFGVDATAVTEEVFGQDIVDWCTVRYAPRRKQQALAMLLVAAIRDARAASRVVQGLRRMERPS